MFLSTPRLRSFISLLIVTPIGFASRFYTGPGGLIIMEAASFTKYSGVS